MVIVWYVKIIECFTAGLQSTNKTLHKALADRPQQMYRHTLQDDTEAVFRCEFVCW